MKSFFVVFAVFALVLVVAFAGKLDKHNSTWAVLIAGDKGWDSYPVQSSMYKMYHILRKAGIPNRHIITFFADDIANNDLNPFPGEVYNDKYIEGGHNDNVYAGVVKDYIGEDASSVTLSKVMKGITPDVGSGKVLASTEFDNVLLYYVGSGDRENRRTEVNMPHLYLSDDTMEDIITNMTGSKRFKKLMVFWDSNYSSDMFNTIPAMKRMHNVYIVTSRPSGWTETTPYCTHDIFIHNYVSSCWSNLLTSAIEDSSSSLTVETLYSIILKGESATCQLGDAFMKNMTFSSFIKNTDSHLKRKTPFSSQHHVSPFNVPGLSFCEYDSCTESSCDCYAICKSRGFDSSRCTSYCCVNYDCY